jgi:hypothetical protein
MVRCPTTARTQNTRQPVLNQSGRSQTITRTQNIGRPDLGTHGPRNKQQQQPNNRQRFTQDGLKHRQDHNKWTTSQDTVMDHSGKFQTPEETQNTGQPAVTHPGRLQTTAGIEKASPSFHLRSLIRLLSSFLSLSFQAFTPTPLSCPLLSKTHTHHTTHTHTHTTPPHTHTHTHIFWK